VSKVCYNKYRKKEKEGKTMTTYTIYLNNKPIATLSGTEAAYEAYSITRELAETLGYTCCLVWDETGEIIAEEEE
jgi:hypothetical protein